MSNPLIEARTARTRWFLEDRFGMFIHWGLYAIPARGEWMRSVERMPEDQYLPFFDEFDPVDFDPAKWARLAKEAGMRYAVLTAKHHDGFCLFDSALTDFKSTNTHCGRDLVRDFLDAFRAEGLKVGLYYSLLDWHHPDYPHESDPSHPMRGNPDYRDDGRDFSRYVAYLHGQVKELLTHYGRLDLLWLDFSYGRMTGEVWGATELVETVRELQPWLLIDNRFEAAGDALGSICSAEPRVYAGDFATPEQWLPSRGLIDANGDPVPWEACITLNDNWGYHAGDHHYKSARHVVRNLAECVSKNGNLLLNVGPDAKGTIPAESVRILREVGDWMADNAPSIRGCGAASLPKPEWGRLTQRGNTLYAHVLEESTGPYVLDCPPDAVDRVRLLASGAEVAVRRQLTADGQGTLTAFSLPGGNHPLPDERDTVVEITLR